MTILLVEDDVDLATNLCESLQDSGYAVNWVVSGTEAERALQAGSYRLILLDLNLPGKSGFEVLRDLRARGLAAHVLVLSARDETADRVRALDLGADDYLVKPFELSELEARVRAQLRRSPASPATRVELGGLVLDAEARTVSAHGALLDLTAKEYALVELLMLRAGQVVSKASISERMCPPGEAMTAGAIETLVHRARRKIERGGIELRALRGFGYLIEAPGRD